MRKGSHMSHEQRANLIAGRQGMGTGSRRRRVQSAVDNLCIGSTMSWKEFGDLVDSADLKFTAQSACKGLPTSLFYPTVKVGHVDPNEELVVGVCNSCPVQVSCLAWAAAHSETNGYWGGVEGVRDVGELRRLVKSRRNDEDTPGRPNYDGVILIRRRKTKTSAAAKAVA